MPKYTLEEIRNALKPDVLRWIAGQGVSGSIASLSAHNLAGDSHYGTLNDSQAPQFLKSDGSRQLTGNLSVSTGVTIDGYDVSTLGALSHVAATALDSSITVSGQSLGVNASSGLTVSNGLKVDLDYGFVWRAMHEFAEGLKISEGKCLTFADDTALARQAANVLGLGQGDSFRSPDYLSGVKGWKIDSDGSAEFQNLRARGSIQASVFEYSTVSSFAGSLFVGKSAAKLKYAFSVEETTTASPSVSPSASASGSPSSSVSPSSSASDSPSVSRSVSPSSSPSASPSSSVSPSASPSTGAASASGSQSPSASVSPSASKSTSPSSSASRSQSPSSSASPSASRSASPSQSNSPSSSASPSSSTSPSASPSSVSPFTNAHKLVVENSANAWAFADNDILCIKAFTNDGTVGEVWMTITRTGVVNEYIATIQYGTIGVTFPAGTSVQDYGQSGDGYFCVSADGTFGTGTLWAIKTHAGQPWTTNTTQVYADSTGKLLAGAGAVKLDSSGIGVLVDTSYADLRSYRFVDGSGNPLGGVYGYLNGYNSLKVESKAIASKPSFTELNALAPSTYLAQVNLFAQSGNSDSCGMALIHDSNDTNSQYAQIVTPNATVSLNANNSGAFAASGAILSNGVNVLTQASQVHGLPASVNVLGSRAASGQFVQYASGSTTVPTGGAADLTLSWPVAFSAIVCATGCERYNGNAAVGAYVKSYSTTGLTIRLFNSSLSDLTVYADAIGIGT